MRGLSLVVASGGHSSLRCAGLSLSRPLFLRSTGSRRAGSVVAAHGPSCSVACGIFPDQGSNPCPLHWQADSEPLHHQGSPHFFILEYTSFLSPNMCNIWYPNVLMLLNLIENIWLIDWFIASFIQQTFIVLPFNLCNKGKPVLPLGNWIEYLKTKTHYFLCY